VSERGEKKGEKKVRRKVRRKARRKARKKVRRKVRRKVKKKADLDLRSHLGLEERGRGGIVPVSFTPEVSGVGVALRAADAARRLGFRV